MSNLLACSVIISLDGQEYVIRYRALAFIQYASECGGDLLNDVRRIGSELVAAGKMEGREGLGAPIATMRDILWAGLVDAQPILKRDDVARMFGFREMEPIMQAISEALRLSMPEIDLTNNARPTGARSRSPLPNGEDSGPTSANESVLVPTTSKN